MTRVLFLWLLGSLSSSAATFTADVKLDIWWMVPFAGMLLSIALCPLLLANWWHQHFAKVALFWGTIVVIALLASQGLITPLLLLVEIFLKLYLPFIALIGTLFIVNGSIHIVIKGHGTPWRNTLFLGISTLGASFIGTTGAAMLFIRPFLRFNSYRRSKVHLVVFFIFLVCNIGGCLTPIGDPPLFLGFLEGVPFFWPLKHLAYPMLLVAIPLLLIFLVLDWIIYRKDPKVMAHLPEENHPLVRVQGSRNIPWLLLIIVFIISCGLWPNPPKLFLDITIADLVRDGGLIAVAIIVKRYSPKFLYELNHFSWEPLREVAILFAGIFITMVPVILLFHAGEAGPFATILKELNPNGQPQNLIYFWLTGLLSGFLDNAPTYLLFFFLAGGGDTQQLIGPWSQTLVAISIASVFFGAMTYIGNAPNFMVKAIAEHSRVRMPSFFGYLLWSTVCLLPLLIILSLISFNS